MPGHRVDSDLTAEKQLVLVADVEVEYSGILQEELTLLGYEYLKWREIKRLEIDFGVGKIRVSSEIQDEVRTEAILDIESPSEWKFGVLPSLFVVLDQTVRLNDEESCASDVRYTFQFSRLGDFRDSESSSVSAPKILFILSANESLKI